MTDGNRYDPHRHIIAEYPGLMNAEESKILPAYDRRGFFLETLGGVRNIRGEGRLPLLSEITFL